MFIAVFLNVIRISIVIKIKPKCITGEKNDKQAQYRFKRIIKINN